MFYKTLSESFFLLVKVEGVYMKYYFTSESVTEGHPDKICDKISDAILDSTLRDDPNSKMAVEATIKDDLILIYGEENTKANLNYSEIAKKVLKDIGYNEDYNVIVKVSKQSSEINTAVEKKVICAGDQGIMFGYANSDTLEFMPLPITLANKLAKRLTYVRKKDKNSILRPDGKTEVVVEYIDDKPIRVDTIIIASQHIKDVEKETLDNYIIKNVINPVIPKKYIDNKTKILINTSGSFIKGGSFADSGTTGRKIICDTYGGMGRIGGGCFSSKDPSKVDRSGAYYARYVAKNIVAHKLAIKCEIQVSYAIGIPKPISLYIDTFNTNKVDIEKIYKYVLDNFDFSVSNMIKELDLKKPIYYDTAAYGHFGNNNYSWEKIKD